METERAPEAYTIPNFREDERILARYDSMLKSKIKNFYSEHESHIKRNASEKRDEQRAELREAEVEAEKKKALADAARDAYRAVLPNNVKKNRLIEPSMMDGMKTLGKAKALYAAAEETWLAAEAAQSEVRRLEHNEEQLEIELKKAIERSPAVAKDVTESKEWLAEIHADEDMAEAKAKADAVNAERAAYAARLAAGQVTQEEIRLRAFADQEIAHMPKTIDAAMFLRIDQYGPKTYYIIRDLRNKLYALPYDDRLMRVMWHTFDIVRAGTDFIVRKSLRPNSPIGLTLLDHFIKCGDPKDENPAREAYHQHQEWLKRVQPARNMVEMDEVEATIVELLAAYAEKV
jgi:hypothetical protein